MKFVNPQASKNRAEQLFHSALSAAFLMDTKPDVDNLTDWVLHCGQNVRAQAHAFDEASSKLTCSIVTGIRGGVVKMAQGPQLESGTRFVKTYFTSAQKGPWEDGGKNVYWRTPRVDFLNKTDTEWKELKENLFYTGPGGYIVGSQKEGTLLSAEDQAGLPFIVFPWNISATLIITSDNPATSVTNPTQGSTSGYKKDKKAQQYYSLVSGSLGSRVNTYYSYGVGSPITLVSGVPFCIEPFYRYGLEYNYTDGGRTQTADGVGPLTGARIRQSISLPAPMYFHATSTEPDSVAFDVKYAVTAFKLVGDVYLTILENGKDFTCSPTLPHDRPDITITNKRALSPFVGEPVMNIGGRGAIR